MKDRISFSEFKDMLLDPDVPEREIAKYLELDELNSRPFAPAYTVNARKVDDENERHCS